MPVLLQKWEEMLRDGFMEMGDVMEQRGPEHIVWIDRKKNIMKLSQVWHPNSDSLRTIAVAISILQLYQGMPGSLHCHCIYTPEVFLCACCISLVGTDQVTKSGNTTDNNYGNHMTGRVCGHWSVGGHLLRQQRPHSPDVHLRFCTALLSPGCSRALQRCVFRACSGFLSLYHPAVPAKVAVLMCSSHVAIVSDYLLYTWAVASAACIACQYPFEVSFAIVFSLYKLQGRPLATAMQH